jgi:hypothetical protein
MVARLSALRTGRIYSPVILFFWYSFLLEAIVTLLLMVSQSVCLGVESRLRFKTKVKVKVILRPTVSRQVRFGVRHPSGTRDPFFFLFEIVFRQFQVCYL